LLSFANAQSFFIHFIRVSICIVMVWIGGLKALQYEADGIVPFVANSPVMSFFYSKEAPESQQYKTPEGKTVQKNLEWHNENFFFLAEDGIRAFHVTGVQTCALPI